MNNAINILKGIACIFVVWMHCEFPGVFGDYVQCIGRFSVPFFFAVSGYFCFYEDRMRLREKIPGKVIHILKITLWSTFIYLLWAFVKRWVWNEELLLNNIDVRLIKFVIFNEPFVVGGHLWFLFALLYSFIIIFFIERLGFFKYSSVVSVVLVLFYFIVSYGFHLMDIDIPNCLYRNFLLEALPLMLFGYSIHKNEKLLLKKFSDRSAVALLIAGLILSVVERYFLGRDFGMHIGSILMLFALFLLSVTKPKIQKFSWLRILGEKYSLFIYIAHILIWQLIYYFAVYLGISENSTYLWLQPVLVLLLTIFAGMLFYLSKEAINKKYESRYSC